MTFLPITFLLGTLFYLVYPLLVAVTPADVFGHPFGPWLILTWQQSFVMYPFALLCFGLFWRTTPPLMRGYARMTRAFLAPTEKARLANRVVQLTESRAETVDTQAAELRRIERDLHDGAQARLVSLGMSLGLAESLLASDPNAAQELLVEAREATGLALSELRDLVRGIHPPVLADRGLDGAVRALAMASPLPVEVGIDLPGRPPAPVESAVYFAVAETLTNSAKHSGATSAWIRIVHADGRLGVMVGDDGRGGATQPAAGGLHGIERRLAAFDGTLVLASPVGGPTIVTMELPCELSSVKTSPSCGTA
jgi:signal transduction histidine kinase